MTRYRYTPELLAEAAANSVSIAGVLRYLNIKWSGGSHHHISRRLRHFGIDTSHFTGKCHNKGKHSPKKIDPELILVARPDAERRTKRQLLHRALLAIGVPEKCATCGVGRTWNGQPLTLHIDHINGDFLDNRPCNLRFLCPNCHSQTPTFAGRRRDKPAADGVSSVRDAVTPRPVLHSGPWTQSELTWQ
jgi:hypothetical protein